MNLGVPLSENKHLLRWVEKLADLTRPAARARVTALVARLRATGWVIASHTYGHINLSRDSLDVIARDTHRWQQLTAGWRTTDAGR